MCNCRRRRRSYCCMNNPSEHKECVLETLCDNVPNEAESFDEDDNGFPENPMYAQSYVPVQVMNNTFMPCSGMHKGTIFPELVSEYCPGQSMAGIQYIMDTNRIKGGCNG